ncbi:hypothetical protein ACFQL1_05690 [Halomicroarcula sp. GCM10025709]|uniref:hypothetical protein n=1 Tax=Haloarcula TaxID=2237 RepID=UPI0024C2CBF3|nr:hypothetical protein [Halomicroarcula sp. YJ-61-S]
MLALPLGQWVLVCLASGAMAAALMNIPMYVQPQGYQPASVAAAGLRRCDPTEVSQPLAVAVHQVTGTVATLLYGGVALALSVLPSPLSLNGVPVIPHLVGVAVLTLFIYYFFERIAMPRAGGSLREEATPIVRQWALSAFIYGVTLALLVPVMVRLLSF